MTTRTIDPTGDDLKRIVATVAADTPVTMLNLLRFRDQAAYPATDDAKPCSGRDAYARYSRQALAHVRAVGGEPVVIAEVLGRFIGPDNEDWDEMLLVRYPSLSAFLAMIGNPDYQAATIHRTAALADARLIVTRTPA
ncbi:DUF1330 domain-containing protein [Abyssibacter sp.]|uniref:DUF1330 domain-containing protein n=1 Tax=Abyssibacter sp. TaxID=2320200 RepID=UPI0025B7F561|nr:DUF1330 domain-containing protein [Abyssibacter sp.]MCK5858120.1 DUF1330 domain-containing protein [Abyssibacter sp.]